MKKFLTMILSLVLALCFVCGCTETTPSGGTSGGADATGTTDTEDGAASGTTETDGDGMTEDSYTVTLQFPSSTTILPSLEGIYAIWSNDTSVYTAEFNSSGVAYCNELDGEYTVTLSETPEGYTYNPNIYEADGGAEGRSVDIYMYAITEFTGGTGYSLNQGVRATASRSSLFAVYRIYFYAAGTEFYFEFSPENSGRYSVETYVSTYENNVNPTITLYSYSYTVSGTATSGGESGTYTKNARYEVTTAVGQVGGSFYFGVKIDCASGTYPQYVDLAITWEDKYTDEDMYAQYGGAYQSVEVPDISTDWKTPSGTYRMVYTSNVMDGNFSSTTTINGTRYAQIYQWTDGFYYYCKDPASYYSAIGKTSVDESDADTFETYWTLLFVQIKDAALFTVSGSSILGLLQAKIIGYNYRVSVKINGVYKNYNYYNMLVAYQAAANSNSCYPVTEELKTCLQYVSMTNTYFYDGNGWLEDLPFYFSSTDEDQWLYGCGVYL